MNLREKGLESVNWIYLAQDGAGSCKHGNEPSGSIKVGEHTIGFTRTILHGVINSNLSITYI
jgi:hypothetical protein